MNLDNHPIYNMAFSKVYPMYVQKVQKKGRTQHEVDSVIFWLTGYDDDTLAQALEDERSFHDFFEKAPKLNPERTLIKGVVCGVRVEEVPHPLMQNIRYLDKLIDELAKGKSLDKIKRSR